MDNVTIENMNLLEFILDENTSLYYNEVTRKWFFEYVDVEDGEEFTINFNITDSLPLKVNEHILTLDEFMIYEEIVEEESKNNES